MNPALSNAADCSFAATAHLAGDDQLGVLPERRLHHGDEIRVVDHPPRARELPWNVVRAFGVATLELGHGADVDVRVLLVLHLLERVFG